MNAVFTIVAKNYTGLAQVLEKSVKQNDSADFFIFIADEWEGNKKLPDNVIVARETLDFSPELWEQMAFQYNLVEFCTAIKPACFQYLLKKQYENIIYFDPDIYVFNTLSPVYEYLETAPVLVTPHIVKMQIPYLGNYPDYLFLLNGTFNLGFIALKKHPTSLFFLEWWQSRLINEAFFDFEKGMATDQKWLNLLPALLPANAYQVSRHLGMNMAPWNFHERKILFENGSLFVQDRENEKSDKVSLLFVHFSGYDYQLIGQDKAVHKTTSIIDYPDLHSLFSQYAEALNNSDFNTYISQVYSYNYFENRVGILSLHRRLYRSLSEGGKTYHTPFCVGEGSFYQLLKSKRLLDFTPVSADKISNKNIPNFDAKYRVVQSFFNFIRIMIGIRRYSMMIRFLKRFFSEENQIFMVDKELGKKLR
ncbi:MAG: hypothetical protein KGP35_01870 [Bacteroidetes bacterium]|nr:hypothetical protein [Bacteroidota bacterium]